MNNYTYDSNTRALQALDADSNPIGPPIHNYSIGPFPGMENADLLHAEMVRQRQALTDWMLARPQPPVDDGLGF